MIVFDSAAMFKIKQFERDMAYQDISVPLEVDLALQELAENMELMLKLAEYLNAVERLGLEIEKTRRRVNALDYILIPTITETISYINSKLDELERDNLNRLMRVKEIVR